MIPYGIFSQTLFMVLSIALVVTYIKPTLTEIGATQDKIETYVTEIDKVSTVNARLASLVSSYDNISQADRLRLLAYMPDEVDTIAVPRDLVAIATQAGVIVRSVKYEGSPKTSGSDVVSDLAVFDPSVDPELESVDKKPDGHKFSVDFEGSYAQLKSMLAMMEENVYPLEIYSLDVNRSEGGFLTVKMDIVTYDRILPAPQEEEFNNEYE